MKVQANTTLRTFATGLSALALLAGSAAADFTVSGTLHYVDKSFTYGGGWTGAKPEVPARLAHVEVVNATTGTVLGTGLTGQDGSYAISATGSGTADIKVRAISKSTAFGGKVLRVTNTSGSNYSVETPVWSNWNLSSDLDAGDLVSALMTSGGKHGNPFNILDQMVAGVEYVKSLGANNPSVNLRLNWPGGSGSFASGTQAWIADDDGYDDIVQLHEFGHVLHNLYSDSDNPGGSHFISDSDQDPRLSYGEGWASYFSSAVRHFQGVHDAGIYVDANGGSNTGGKQLYIRYENQAPYGSSIRGEADEGAVSAALYDVIDTAATDDKSPSTDDDPIDGSALFAGGMTGDQLLWEAFVGPVKQSGNVTIRDHWNGLFSGGDPGLADELASVFDGLGMRFYNDASEPNNSVATATPISTSNSWLGPFSLYYSAATPAAPGEGDKDYFAFEVCGGAVLEITTRYPGGAGDAKTYADPRLSLIRPDGTVFASDNDSGTGRNAKLTSVATDMDGVWTVEVSTNHAYRKTGSYELRVLQESGPGGLCPCCPLNADLPSVSLLQGGTQALSLDAGVQHAGKFYWILGSASGSTPGLPTEAGVLPLNFDGYFQYTLGNPNQAPLSGSLGVLDPQGQAAAQFSLPPGASLSLFGTVLNHAYVVLGPLSVEMVSNAVPVTLSF